MKTDQMWGLMTGVKECLQVYCLKKLEHKVAISETSNNTKGIDFEGVSEVYLRLQIDMLINSPGRGFKQTYMRTKFRVEIGVKDRNLRAISMLDSILVMRLNEFLPRVSTTGKKEDN